MVNCLLEALKLDSYTPSEELLSEDLEDAGVYKCDEAGRTAFMRFINTVNE